MLINREKFSLTEIQYKILKSGWGNSAIDDAVVEKIVYDSDGLKVNGYLGYPKDTSKKYPCVIWCRGGFGNAGALDNFNAQGILGQLASWGYVVLESQYRGNVGGEGKDEFGGSDVNDVLNLLKLAEELDFANTEIWGIEGWSRGGLMTYLTLLKDHRFKAAVTNGGISNLECNLGESSFMKKLVNLPSDKMNNEYCKNRDIINSVESFSKNTPMLLMHGVDDKRVPPHHSIDLSLKFIENKIEHRLILFENGDHFLKMHKKEVDEQRKNWFEKYLK